jgi:hypothetical protein
MRASDLSKAVSNTSLNVAPRDFPYALAAVTVSAEICAYKCLCAAGAVVDIESIKRVIKVTGMVNTTDGFNNTTEVIMVVVNS